MIIIEIDPLSNGAHRNQTGTFSAVPDGWAIIPDTLDTPNYPFGDITVDYQTPPVVTSWTPLPIPEPEPEPKPSPTTEDRVASFETETKTLKTQVQTLTNSDKVNSGTYTGTGLYGESNPNSVRPNIPTKVLMIIQNNETILTLSRTESTDEPFVWFASSAKEQCNENGLDYNWIAVS